MARTEQPRPDSTSPREGASKRRRGGQELPDEVQDRPEQNAGYDEAVREGPPGTPEDPFIELNTDLRTNEGEDLEPETSAEPSEPGREERLREIDERAARGAAAEVRHRERRR